MRVAGLVARGPEARDTPGEPLGDRVCGYMRGDSHQLEVHSTFTSEKRVSG